MAQQYIGTARWGTKQTVSYTGTAGITPTGVGVGVTKVRVLCTTDAWVFPTDGPAFTVATSALGSYVPALTAEYITVSPGQKISAVQVASGGNLEVTECV